MTAAEYLVSKAIVSEAAIYSALAEHCEVPYVPEMGFRPQSVNNIPIGLGSLQNGPLLVGVGETSPHYVIAPEYSQFAEVRAYLKRFPHLAGQVRISTPSAIQHAMTVLNTPAGDLESRFPEFSAKVRLSRPQLVLMIGMFAAFVLGIAMPKVFVFYALASLFSLACILTGLGRWESARATAADVIDLELPPGLNLPGIRWPRYTVLVPLYKETRVVDALVEGLQRLDYPPDRLDIKFLLECDDLETRAAFQRPLDDHMEVVIVPAGIPRTKPRALAYGLETARGELVTIYDAEDQPQRDQLKKAALFFALGPANLACLQARLAIDNVNESFFSRQYALEYACLFDQVIPWFHKLGWPFPLGGTSNHFRRSVLENVGGWDKYNVTEDADLGIRLARFGYLTGVLPSTTFEEAPLNWSAWVSQRSRWYKGWLQTLCVHLRQPGRICRELGAVRLAALSIMIGGSFVMMAIHPFFLLALAGYFLGILPWPQNDNLGQDMFLGLCAAGALVGYCGSAFAGWQAGRRRGYRPGVLDGFLLPVYWLCTSIAFYRALWGFLTRPHEWNKTEHGLSKRRGGCS